MEKAPRHQYGGSYGSHVSRVLKFPQIGVMVSFEKIATKDKF